MLALPSTDDFICGLTVNGWIVADEAARLSEDLIAALRPMRARCPEARFAMLSTAWSRTDPFWTAWESDDASVIKLRATAEIPGLIPKYSWSKSAALSVSTPSTASISASRSALKPVLLVGSFMSVQSMSTRRSSDRVLTLRRPSMRRGCR